METLLGTLIWGGLLLLVLAWFGGRSQPPSEPHDDATWTARSTRPAAPPRPVHRETERETEALVDGLVIGHFLTRDHYERRIEALDEALDQELAAARADDDRHLLAGEDDLAHPADVHEHTDGFGLTAPYGLADPDDPFDLEPEGEGSDRGGGSGAFGELDEFDEFDEFGCFDEFDDLDE